LITPNPSNPKKLTKSTSSIYSSGVSKYEWLILYLMFYLTKTSLKLLTYNT
jgi:hypothetical protein